VSPEIQQTVLEVTGMTCSKCVLHLEGALREVAGVRGVEVALREGRAVVGHEGVASATLIEAVREAGYEAREAAP
jgi:copper chaperone